MCHEVLALISVLVDGGIVDLLGGLNPELVDGVAVLVEGEVEFRDKLRLTVLTQTVIGIRLVLFLIILLL